MKPGAITTEMSLRPHTKDSAEMIPFPFHDPNGLSHAQPFADLL
jgi:hypothetical protein